MFLGRRFSQTVEPDIFIHNVSPDLLTIHKDITPAMTHRLKRFVHAPTGYGKSALVRFHLLVDDMAHYGKIHSGATLDFDPYSEGYAYRKGRALIGPIIDFHQSLGQCISFSEAAYRSHILIEMAFDQVLHERENKREIATVFYDALNYTIEFKLDEFCRISSWIYDVRAETIAQALAQGKLKYNQTSQEPLNDVSGRIALYIDKFGLDHDESTTSRVNNLLCQGMETVGDYEGMLATVIKAIRTAGFTYPL